MTNNSNDVNMNFIVNLITLHFLEHYALKIITLQVLYALVLTFILVIYSFPCLLSYSFVENPADNHLIQKIMRADLPL